MNQLDAIRYFILLKSKQTRKKNVGGDKSGNPFKFSY